MQKEPVIFSMKIDKKAEKSCSVFTRRLVVVRFVAPIPQAPRRPPCAMSS